MTSTAEDDLMRSLHDDHAEALCSYALRLTGGNRARAEDVVQETLLRAWRHPGVLDQSVRSARAWLFTVARRLVIDEWRAAATRSEVTTAQPPETPVSDGTERAIHGWLLGQALDQLPEHHRDVLVRCFFEGLSVDEIALDLGIPRGTVRSRRHYALRALRLVLEDNGGIR